MRSDATTGVGTNVEVWTLDLSTGETQHYETHNVTCEGFHEALLDSASPFDSGLEIGQLAIGTDGSSGTSVSDRSLNTEVGRSLVRVADRSNRTLTVRAFAPSQLTDPNPIDELGLTLGTDGSGDLVNHATISDVDKSSADTILIATIDISIQDVSE